MVIVSEDRFFHLRGRHVQHVHGRNNTAGSDHLNGAMIALMPTEEDAQRLRFPGGERTDDLHLTLYYLGEGADWSEQSRESVINSVIDRMSDAGPTGVVGNVFGVNHWNGGGDEPSWVLAVGDVPEDDRPEGFSSLESVRELVTDALENSHSDTDIPTQHTPWVPHICMAYTGDLSLVESLEERLGEVTFDRIRIAFAGEHTDVFLAPEGLTAAVFPLRRNPNEYELRARVDFARIQSEWEAAVDSALSDVRPIREVQREQITAEILAAAETDNLDALNAITLNDEEMSAVLFEHMTRAAEQAGNQQQEEAEAQGVAVPNWSLEDENLTAAVGLGLLRSISQLTSRLINSRFIQSAVGRALGLVGRPQISPEEVADEVSSHLAELSQASVRESIGGAITSAQNEGRRTVLAIAPEASEYVASEILDQNVCTPCRRVDGRSFPTLADATEQYPSGGFRDCLGGVRCRGTIVAVWADPFEEEE